jgi:hypothetical protein
MNIDTWIRLETIRLGKKGFNAMHGILSVITHNDFSLDDIRDLLDNMSGGYDSLRPPIQLLMQQVGDHLFTGITTKEARDILSGEKEPHGICPGCGGKIVEKRDWSRIMICQHGHELPFSKEQWMDLALTNAVGKPRWIRTWPRTAAIGVSHADVEKLRKFLDRPSAEE